MTETETKRLLNIFVEELHDLEEEGLTTPNLNGAVRLLVADYAKKLIA